MKLLRKITRYLLCIDENDIVFFSIAASITALVFNSVPLMVLFGGLTMGLLFEVNDKTFKRFFTHQIRNFGMTLLKLDKGSFAVSRQEISDWVLFNYSVNEYAMFEIPYDWLTEEKIEEKYRELTNSQLRKIYIITAANKDLSILFKMKWG